MNSKKTSGTVHRLLHDSDFIMWCIAPTQELDKRWYSWLEKHPEEQAAANQTRRILLSARLNDFSIPSDKSEQIWERLEVSLQKKHPPKRQLIFIRYIAACVIALIVGVAGYQLFSEKPFSEYLLTATNPTDSTRTEVTLIFDTQKAIQVEDNALIAYQSGITVKEKEKERIITPKPNGDNLEKEELNTLVVPRGRRSSLLLEDGSRVWVNSGSVLRFPSHFAPSHRSIEVEEGEIYIEVAKSATPFYVRTNRFTVNVLGTKFNISAYKEEQEQSVVLVEGSVVVETADKENIQLEPERKLTILPEGNRIDEVDVYDYISWKDGLLQFKRETMENIVARLSRYYNVPIRCNAEIGKRKSSGKLVLFDDVHQVMKTFTILYDTQYHIEADTFLIE